MPCGTFKRQPSTKPSSNLLLKSLGFLLSSYSVLIPLEELECHRGKGRDRGRQLAIVWSKLGVHRSYEGGSHLRWPIQIQSLFIFSPFILRIFVEDFFEFGSTSGRWEAISIRRNRIKAKSGNKSERMAQEIVMVLTLGMILVVSQITFIHLKSILRVRVIVGIRVKISPALYDVLGTRYRCILYCDLDGAITTWLDLIPFVCGIFSHNLFQEKIFGRIILIFI